MLALSTARGTARRCRPRLGIATWLPPAEKRSMTAVQAVACGARARTKIAY